MAPLGEYLQTWKLKLSTTKTVSAVFHHKEAKRELKVNFSNESLPFYSEPKYLRLGVTLDRSLTYRRHLESLRKKLTSRVALSRRLTGSGAGPTTLQIATLALVHSAAEYCSTVWCRGAHTRLIDPAINDALRIATGSLRSTPADNLPILANIQPAELRRRSHTVSSTPSHGAWTCPPECESQIETPICTRRTIHLTTITYVRRITNGMRSDWRTRKDSAVSSPTPTLKE